MRIRFALPFYFVIAFMAFMPGHGGMIVTDSNGWFSTYDRLGWQGIFTSFTDRSLHHVYHLVGFICYRLFGFNTVLWGLFTCSMHALAATSGFVLFRRVYALLNFRFAPWAAFFGALLFLINANQAEPVLWAACVHYPISVMFICAALYYMVQYATIGNGKNAALFLVCYIIALFALELTLALPFICIPFVLLFKGENFSKQRFLSLLGVAVSIILIYLGINKLRFGSIVGHYGASAHLNTDPLLIVANIEKYLAKYFLFSQFWPYDVRIKLYTFFETPACVYGSMAAAGLLVIGFLLLRKKLPLKLQAFLLLVACAVAGLAPTINLYFTTLLPNEGDRMGYLFSVFFSHSVALLAFSVLPFGFIILVAYLGLNAWFLKFNVWSWRGSGKIQKQMVQGYKWKDAPEVVILNLPDNFRGAYMYRCFDTGAEFKDAMKARGVELQNVTELLKYNMNDVNDCVTVEKVSETELKVTLAQWGNWWWINGKGAYNYSTAMYSITVDEWNHSYIVKFKDKKPGTVYLYQCGGEWREVSGF